MEEILPTLPWAWLYFVTFILAGTFVALNFFVGIIVNNLQSLTSMKTMIWSRSASISRDWKSVSTAYREATWPVECSMLARFLTQATARVRRKAHPPANGEYLLQNKLEANHVVT